MGNLYTTDLADAATDGSLDLKKAIGFHLTTNFFPALPGDYIEPLVDAVERVAEGYGYDLIALPEGINPRPRKAEYDVNDEVWVISADWLVDALHAWPFVDAVLEGQCE